MEKGKFFDLFTLTTKFLGFLRCGMTARARTYSFRDPCRSVRVHVFVWGLLYVNSVGDWNGMIVCACVRHAVMTSQCA